MATPSTTVKGTFAQVRRDDRKDIGGPPEHEARRCWMRRLDHAASPRELGVGSAPIPWVARAGGSRCDRPPNLPVFMAFGRWWRDRAGALSGPCVVGRNLATIAP